MTTLPSCPDLSIRSVPGIGKSREDAFARLGIYTLLDLLFRAPRAYENRGYVRLLKDGIDGSPSSYVLTIGTQPKNARLRRELTLTKFRAFDSSGAVEITFFNQPYLKDTFKVGEEYRFYGKLTVMKSALQMATPKYERISADNPLPDFMPVYSMSEGLTPKVIRDAVEYALRTALPHIKDHLPEDIRLRAKLPSLATALRGIHMPKTEEELQRSVRRMAFDEMFLYAACAYTNRSVRPGGSIRTMSDVDFSPLCERLPYTLTEAQNRVCQEIASDFSRGDGTCMNRILIGDVGCGKTVCAAIAIYLTVKNGFQAALMAPTEILARQHYHDLEPLLGSLGIRTALLLGSTSQKEKKRIYAALAGESDECISLVIGTHALISEKVRFTSLGLTVTDEQHRFGVMQRAALRKKNPHSHLLVMTATPIPRTLALVLYGDLSVSKIDEMPAGRQRVSTFVVDDSYRERMYGFVRKEIESGGQVYIVCPSIEEKEEGDESITLEELWRHDSLPKLKHAHDMYEELQNRVFPDIPIGFLHGKMKSDEKDVAMKDFIDGRTKILVSTTVIEVGVNVPNASLMIVENAERFGLSQLHQLRGRVGRGNRKSYCILVSDAKNEEARARLDTMHTTYNGYQIAEADLKQRGPGDFFAMLEGDALRQSGAPTFRYATMSDEALLALAFDEAKKLFSEDPSLSDPLHMELKNKIQSTLTLNAEIIS